MLPEDIPGLPRPRPSLVGATVELAAIRFFSHLSDTWGRRKVYTAGAVIAGLFAIPYF